MVFNKFLYSINQERNDLYYWICDKKNNECIDTNIFYINGQHIIRTHNVLNYNYTENIKI